MLLELPFDINQKVYVIANKKKMNTVGRVITEKNKVVYSATVIGYLLEKENDQLCIIARLLVETDLRVSNTRSRPQNYCFVDEVKSCDCFADKKAANGVLQKMETQALE